MLWRIKQWPWTEANPAVPLSTAAFNFLAVPQCDTEVFPAPASMLLLALLRYCSAWNEGQSHEVQRLHDWSDSVLPQKLVSTMWKLPIGKNKSEGPILNPIRWSCSSCCYSPSEFGFLRKVNHCCIGGDMQSGMGCVTQQAKSSSWYNSWQRNTSSERLATLTQDAS